MLLVQYQNLNFSSALLKKTLKKLLYNKFYKSDYINISNACIDTICNLLVSMVHEWFKKEVFQKKSCKW